MGWKYKVIFLLLLSCLVVSKRSYSQHCVCMRYDMNGNRISQYVHECGDEYKCTVTRDVVMSEEISIDGNVEEVVVYPNPNKGVFTVTVDVDDESQTIVQVYNNNGVLIMTKSLTDDEKVDVSDNPSGMYLLRIIKGEYVFSKIVVKL